ncbi:NAD(P)/FAD-dependent oxidoreductase [Caminibacter sp.]
MSKKIVVIGGGYGGLRFIETLNGDFDVTLIDKNIFHYMQIESYNYVTGRVTTADIICSLQNLCDYYGVKFICDEAIAVGDKSVKCKKGEYYFDYLIIAVGAKDFMPENLEKYSYKIKDINSAFLYKKEVLQNLFEYVIKNKVSTLVIGGARQSGVELAGELASVFYEHKKEGVINSDFNIVLVEAKNEVLPEMDKFFRENAKKRLEKLGVKLILGELIEGINEREIIIKDKNIAYDLFIFLGGIAPNDFINSLPFEKERGFLKVDEFLRVKENIFAIGDAAIIKDKNGKILPPTAQIAEQSGEYVAKYLMGKRDKFNGKIIGMFCSVGSKWAVGKIGKIYMKGYFAYLIKKAITKMYAFGIKIKANSGYKRR